MIQIDGLTKRYGQHTVVDDLSFSCAAGEVLGFLGPNGAGKSTTMKMLTGFVAPDAGTAAVCGHSIGDAPLAARRHLGYLPEGAPCYPEMTPKTFLDFIADVRGLRGERRVGLAQAILHDPDVLILDEPTDGLDPNQKHEVRELIRSMSADKLIVISTHILEEVEAVCSRAIIIAAGKILADDTPARLAATSRYHNAVRVTLMDGAVFDEARAAIELLPSVGETESERGRLAITAIPGPGSDEAAPWREVTALATERRWKVASLQLEGGRLDDVFRQVTRGTAA